MYNNHLLILFKSSVHRVGPLVYVEVFEWATDNLDQRMCRLMPLHVLFHPTSYHVNGCLKPGDIISHPILSDGVKWPLKGVFTARLHCLQCQNCNRQRRSVCLSVHLSVTFLCLSTEMKIQSCGFQHQVGQSF